eukprot:1177792-Prorocentrum_minimum.AAC.2
MAKACRPGRSKDRNVKYLQSRILLSPSIFRHPPCVNNRQKRPPSTCAGTRVHQREREAGDLWHRSRRPEEAGVQGSPTRERANALRTQLMLAL